MPNLFNAILIFIGVITSCYAFGHGGRYDEKGGHFNRKTNKYHCHKEPCFSIHKKAKGAIREAKKESRAFSTIYNRKDWPHWIDDDHDCQNTRAELLIAAS